MAKITRLGGISDHRIDDTRGDSAIGEVLPDFVDEQDPAQLVDEQPVEESQPAAPARKTTRSRAKKDA